MFPVLACPSASDAESRRAEATTQTEIFLIVMHPPFRCVHFFRRKPLRIRAFGRMSSRAHKSNTIASAARGCASGREELHGGRRNPPGGRRWNPPERRSRNLRGEPRSWIAAPV